MSKNKNESVERIIREYSDIINNPIPNICCTVGYENPNNIYHWRISIMGPKDSLYADGFFILGLEFPKDYPNRRPELYFKTPIYHLNVNSHESEYMNRLGRPLVRTINWWLPSYTVRELLIDLFSIFYLVGLSPFGDEKQDEEDCRNSTN